DNYCLSIYARVPIFRSRHSDRAYTSRRRNCTRLLERIFAASEKLFTKIDRFAAQSVLNWNRQKMDLPAGISTFQLTDRLFGAPLCAILTLFRRSFESAEPPGPRQVQRILFVMFAAQGSLVLRS